MAKIHKAARTPEVYRYLGIPDLHEDLIHVPNVAKSTLAMPELSGIIRPELDQSSFFFRSEGQAEWAGRLL
jgi:hypothetical protein